MGPKIRSLLNKEKIESQSGSGVRHISNHNFQTLDAMDKKNWKKKKNLELCLSRKARSSFLNKIMRYYIIVHDRLDMLMENPVQIPKPL